MENHAQWSQPADDAPIVQDVRSVCHQLGLKGKVYAFGSHASGFKTIKSDWDIVYLSAADEKHNPVDVLKDISEILPDFGFHTIVKVFQARVPLIKAINERNEDIDVCVDNVLGYYNTKLMYSYHKLDPRVGAVGLLVKQWARTFELLNSSDGHMNSYAWTLLTIFFLMNTNPPVIPNLQDLADKDVVIKDSRWGVVADCYCQFWEHTHVVPRSRNRENVWSLIYGFFTFYTTFDWDTHAVCIRYALTDKANSSTKVSEQMPGPVNSKYVPKSALVLLDEPWVVEDPFDIRHNLGANTTPYGRQRMLIKMKHILAVFDEAHRNKITSSPAPNASTPEKVFEGHCPSDYKPEKYYMKCRVNLDTVASKAFLATFEGVCHIERCYFPLQSADRVWWDVFLQFGHESERKKAHTRNESIVNGWQLRLLNCSYHCLPEHNDASHLYEIIEVDGAQPKAPPALVHPVSKTSPVGTNNAKKDKATPAASVESKQAFRQFQ